MDQDLLRSVSRSFYLSMRFLPAPMRSPVSLAYLLARLSDTIADTPGLPADERLQMLADFSAILSDHKARFSVHPSDRANLLTKPSERTLMLRTEELLVEFRRLSEPIRQLTEGTIQTILEGQRWDLRAFSENPVPCSTADDLSLYTYRVAGCVGEFWTKAAFATMGPRFTAPDNLETMLEEGRKLGQALQLVNILRDLHEDLPSGRCYLPANELRSEGWTGVELPESSELAPVFYSWMEICRGLLDESAPYSGRIRDFRIRFCTRLPHRLARKTLDQLEQAGIERVMRERIAIPRSSVWTAIAWSLFC